MNEVVKAVSIVLFPSNEIIRLAIDASKSMQPQNHELNIYNKIPHITLIMGGMKMSSLPAVKQILEDIKRDFPPLTLTLSSVTQGKMVAFQVAEKAILLNLHSRLMNELDNIFQYEVTEHSFTDYLTLHEETVTWVNNFKGNSARDNYNPHITLGDGDFSQIRTVLPLEFISSRIALCELGDYCSCSNILYEVSLI